MKNIPALLLICALSIPAYAEETKSGPASGTSTLAAASAKVTAPLALKDGAIVNSERTEIADGGKAIFEFTVAQAGNYTIHAMANATDEDSNSFFVNIDAQPEDPMIWDIEVTSGFEERVVNWRGNGESGSGEFVPKVFKLTAGKHQLIVVGREPAQLKSVSVRPAAN